MALGLLLSGTSGTLSLDYTLISSPDGEFGGERHTRVHGINNYGEWAGDYVNAADGVVLGFYFDNGSAAVIQVDGSPQTDVLGLNDAGQLVVMSFGPSGIEAFIYDGGTFIPVTIDGASLVVAQDISAGEIVGIVNYADGTGNHGFIADSGGVTTFDAPGAVVDDDSDGTVALGVNELGQVVGYFESDIGLHGFLNDGGSFTTLDVPDSQVTMAADINDWGHIVGNYIDANGNDQGFIRDTDGTYYTIKAPGAVFGQQGSINVTGVNNLGQVVGFYSTFDGSVGFVTTLGMEFTYDVSFFDHPDAVPSSGGPVSFGTEIRNSNVDGDFVGRYSDSAGPGFTGQSFASIGGSVLDLEFVDATGGVAASDVNDLGQIAGYYLVTEDGSSHGFIYDGGDYTTLDSALGDDGTTQILGMSNNGQIVGTYSDGGVEHAFVYDADGFVDDADGFVELDLSEVGAAGNDIIALDVNDLGHIVGTYVDVGTGIRHGFLLKDGVFATIGHPDAAGFGSGGVSINNAGQIAGFYMDSSFTVNAFVYSGGVYSTVGMPNSGGAYGISNSGVVSGSDNDGTTHSGFMAEISGATLVPTLVPPPVVIVWDNPIDGDFEDAANWIDGVVPGETDRAVINRPGEFTVTLTSDLTVGQIVVGSLDNDQMTLRIVDATLQVDNGKIIAPGTIELDSDTAAGAALLIGANTAISGGCGCEPDIEMGLTDPTGPIRIGTADGLADVVRLSNVSAWIAGQGQIGDAMMKLVNFGTIEAMGGTLVLDTGANRIVNDSGFLDAGSDSTLEVNSDINNYGEITAFGDPGHASGTINLNGTVKNFGLIGSHEGGSINVTGALKNYDLISVSGSFSASGPVLNDANGIQSIGNGVIDITGNVVNKGGIAARGDSTTWLHGTVNNALGELIAEDGGTLVVGSTVGAAGWATVNDDGTIHFQGAARAAVRFIGEDGDGGKLILDDASTFKGSIEGFDDTDMIQFKDLLFGSDITFRYIESTNTLKVFDNGVLDSKFSFTGSYTASDFQMIDDGTGHVAIQHFEPPII